MKFDQTVDTKGMLCPLPVLKVQKRLQNMGLGGVLHVVSDDPVAVIDIPHFCEESGHKLLLMETTDAGQNFWIEKGVKPTAP